MLGPHRLAIALLLLLPLDAHGQRAVVAPQATDLRPIDREAPPAPALQRAPTAPASQFEKRRAEPVREGLKELPTDFSVSLVAPSHAQAPVQIKARKQGATSIYNVYLSVQMSLTCDGNKVVKVTPSRYARPGLVFTAYEPLNEKIVPLMPDGGGGWQHPEGCFYSITARIDPGNQISEPNEYDNTDTVHYSAP